MAGNVSSSSNSAETPPDNVTPLGQSGASAAAAATVAGAPEGFDAAQYTDQRGFGGNVNPFDAGAELLLDLHILLEALVEDGYISQRQAEDIRDPEGRDAPEDRAGGDVADDALEDEDVEADRRRNQAHLQGENDEHTEPDRIDAKSSNDREEDGQRQHQHREALEKTPENQIDE